jgi:hypothetical protein
MRFLRVMPLFFWEKCRNFAYSETTETQFFRTIFVNISKHRINTIISNHYDRND